MKANPRSKAAVLAALRARGRLVGELVRLLWARAMRDHLAQLHRAGRQPSRN